MNQTTPSGSGWTPAKNGLTKPQKRDTMKPAALPHNSAEAQEVRKMMYTERITYSEWVEGSGWRLQDSYAGFDDTTLPADEWDIHFNANDFALLITENCTDEDLQIWADDSCGDDKYTYTLTDEDGNEVLRIEIWASKAAEYRLGIIDSVPDVS